MAPTVKVLECDISVDWSRRWEQSRIVVALETYPDTDLKNARHCHAAEACDQMQKCNKNMFVWATALLTTAHWLTIGVWALQLDHVAVEEGSLVWIRLIFFNNLWTDSSIIYLWK